jgi:hypothetical protein
VHGQLHLLVPPHTTGTWGPNLPFFKFRFASADSRQYVENMYFTLLFVLRAMLKVRCAAMRC